MANPRNTAFIICSAVLLFLMGLYTGYIGVVVLKAGIFTGFAGPVRFFLQATLLVVSAIGILLRRRAFWIAGFTMAGFSLFVGAAVVATIFQYHGPERVLFFSMGTRVVLPLLAVITLLFGRKSCWLRLPSRSCALQAILW